MVSALVATVRLSDPAEVGLATPGTRTDTGSPAATFTGSVITAVVPVTVTAPHPVAVVASSVTP